MTPAADIRSQMLLAAMSAVSASRGCVYSVSPALMPYGHQTDLRDTTWLAVYPMFREADPFHPRHFAQARDSVFRTEDGRGSVAQQQAYVAGFRRPMGISYKCEVFLRDSRGIIVGGVRLSRSSVIGEFQDHELALLRALQPVFSKAWTSTLLEARLDDLSIQLTKRENEVLDYLRAGFANKAIGMELGISIVTTKMHVQRILRKAGVTSRTELLAKLSGL